MEGDGVGRNLQKSKLEGRRWSGKEPAKIKTRWKKMNLVFMRKISNLMIRFFPQHFMFIYIALHFFGNTKSIFVVVVVVVVVVVMYDL